MARVGQGIEFGVRGRVGPLPRRAQPQAGGGIEHEEIERQVAREIVQHPGAVGLAAQHGLAARPGLAQQHGVVQGAGGVHHAAQRRHGA